MITKLKYAGIFMASIGYLMNATNLEFTFFGAGSLLNDFLLIIGLLSIAIYALAKLFGK